MKNHDGTAFRRWALGAALAALSLSGHAATTFTKTNGLNGRTLGNTTSIDINGTGAGNIPATALPAGGAISVPTGNFNWTILDAAGHGSMTWDQGPAAKTKANMPVPGQPGRTVPVDVVAKPTKTSVGKALANFGKKSLPGFATAVAVYELIGELGFLPRPKDGETEFYTPARDAEAAWCHGYNGSQSDGCHTGYTFKSSAAAVCAEVLAQREANLPMYSWTGTYSAGTTTELHGGIAAPFGYCRMRNSGTGFGWQDIVLHKTTIGEPIPERIVGEQEIADEIASKSGWPSSSAIGRALSEAINGGRTVDLEAPKVSGPASSPGPTKTETTTNPDGTTTTKTTNTTNNYTYNNNTVTVTNVTTTTTTNNGQTTTTTTEEEAKEEDGCKANPDRVGCAELDTPSGDIPKSSRALTYVAESLGLSGGTCPPPITKTLGGQTVTVFSYAQGCAWLVDYVRPMILMLSAWIAFLILTPGAPTVRGE
jgi:hypothetical protein